MVVNVYIKGVNVDDIKDIVKGFEKIRGYGYLEEVGLEWGEFYSEGGGMEDCVYLYEEMV